MTASGGDPRQVGEAEDIRPVVALPRQGLPNWLIAVGIAALGVLLFVVLDARRRAASAPPAAAGIADAVRTATAAPPLYIPPAPAPAPAPVAPVQIVEPAPAPTPTPAPPPAPPPPPQIVYVPQAAPVVSRVEQPVRPAGGDRSSALVYDAGTPDRPVVTAGGAPIADAATAPGTAAVIARAARLTNRATTVAQGTLIPAVLESALDSTRPGPARALVTRNVRGADGTRILIPRGSRLFGEYRADLAPGQNRALVTWTRLVRPDGAAVALASPSADPLGRVGVRGQVDTHFLTRFGGALLQSVLDVGVNLASRRVNQQVVVALPGGSQSVSTSGSALIGDTQAAPTLRVRQGVSISVFVARDLDFTAVQR